MALPKAQNPLDWTTQLWNISLGKKVDLKNDHWLLGPIGDVGGIADLFIDKLAKDENLAIYRNLPNSGLMDDFEGFRFDASAVNEKIKKFYLNTINYNFEVWTEWKPFFGSLGYLVYKLFSERVQQLNLPQRSLDTALGIKSEIITLKDKNDKIKYRIWFRKLKKNDKVVYSGIYNHCTIPSGEKCLKIIFPLPNGNATVIMKLDVDNKGNLELQSKGKSYGDPGFYFIVKDSKENLWKHYLPSFHERIFVYEDDENTLRADHSMSLWKCTAYKLHYKMIEK